MIEIIKKYSKNPIQTGVLITENPLHIHGLQFILHTRLLFFKNSIGEFEIDFHPQKVFSDRIYILPPLHFQHIRPNLISDVICVDIDNSYLNPYHKQLLNYIKYNRQKSLQHSDNSTNYRIYDKLLEIKDIAKYKPDAIIDILENWIENCFPKELINKRRSKNYSYIQASDNFLTLISKRELNIETCRVSLIASELFTSERNLNRICKAAFGLSTKDVLKYHLAIKAVLLLSNPNFSIVEIANELSFPHLSSFNRYINRLTGFTPTSIRLALINTANLG